MEKNRIIKFRVWDKVLNKMVTQENIRQLLDKINSEEWETEFPYSADEWYPAYQILGIFDYFDDIQKLGIKRYEPSENRFELMQYTGLKDKDGKEIYEGDILKVHYIGGNGVENDKVIFYRGTFCVDYSEDYKPLLNEINHCCEVIGNIYDNPDLVEKEV